MTQLLRNWVTSKDDEGDKMEKKARGYTWKFNSKLPTMRDDLGNTDREGYEKDNRPKTRVRRPKKG